MDKSLDFLFSVERLSQRWNVEDDTPDDAAVGQDAEVEQQHLLMLWESCIQSLIEELPGTRRDDDEIERLNAAIQQFSKYNFPTTKEKTELCERFRSFEELARHMILARRSL